MKRVIIGVFSIMLFFVATGQEVHPIFNKTNRNGIGLFGGITTGYGMAYRHHFDRFSVQANLFPYYQDREGEKDIEFCVGATFMYDIIMFNNYRIFAYQANRYRYNLSEWYSEEYDHTQNPPVLISSEKRTDYTKATGHGLGIGTEVLIYNRVGINLMAGFGVIYRKEKNEWDMNNGVQSSFLITPTIEGGIFYVW